eukprot:jgi/Psemu1/24984/gm1.24984_g
MSRNSPGNRNREDNCFHINRENNSGKNSEWNSESKSGSNSESKSGFCQALAGIDNEKYVN